MRKLLYILGVFLLMSSVYWYARRNIVEPPFPVTEKDSLGVYRLCGTDHYISEDKKLKVSISYIQFREDDSFYQMKLSNTNAPYYGHIHFEDDGMQTGTFCSSVEKIPIKFIVDKDWNASIVCNVDTIRLQSNNE